MPQSSPYKDKNDTWFPVGPASSYPDITESGSVTLSDTITTTTTTCADKNDSDNSNDTTIVVATPGCKVFSVPEHAENGEMMQAVQLSNDPREQVRKGLRKGGQ
ncbi:hypothetical protein EG327_008041 [Venturia inaequalis]|uniref:Uncharacterized protein n=1 Tax=Venturia inaequalis TaxID=5025 RepID=A0A8H3UVC7_VENIN|nr:hypothetical protein EG327_008041 [Venturia inaequalis]